MSTFRQLMLGKRNRIKHYMDLTVVGSPTISNGVVSGFSENDYLQTADTFNPLNAWEMVFKVHFVSTTAKYFVGYNGYGFVVGTTTVSGNKRFRAFFSSNGTSWDIGNATTTTNITDNTDYYVKIRYTGTSYRISQSIDGITYSGEGVLWKTSPIISGVLCIGNGYNMLNFWDGSIDINNSYIKINDIKYIFKLPQS